MTKINLIDQPLAVREAYFAAQLNELIKETGITLGIATKDNLQIPRVGNEVAPPVKQNIKKSKK